MLFRSRISLVVVLVLAVLTGCVYLVFTASLSRSIRAQVDANLVSSRNLAPRLSRLESVDFASLAAGYAHEEEFAKAFALPDLTQRRQALFVAVEARNARLAAQSRKADLIAVTDAAGKVLVRDLNPNVMFGDDLSAKYPAVGIALRGAANKDIWSFEGRAMRVACSPIVGADNRVQGAMVVGFVLTDREARERKEQFGTEVAYTLENRVVATSLVAGGEGDAAKEDVERARELSAAIFAPASAAQAALASERGGQPFSFRLRGEEYRGVAAPLAGNSVNRTAGVVLFRSLAQALHPVVQIGNTMLLFGLFTLLIALGAIGLTARRFLVPLDQLETGVAEVINGNLDYSFAKPSPDYEGLANALNVMLARLLGRPEPSDDEDGDQAAARRWRSDGMFEESDPAQAAAAAASAVGDSASLKLAQEPIDAYYERIFAEYMRAKQQIGERTDGVTVADFRAKLSQNETVLKAKYKCKLVRFRVVVKGKQVTLKPVPIY